MKRRVYEIKQDGRVRATKNAWNTARREIIEIIKGQLLEGETAERFAYDFKRNEYNTEFVEGVETWHTSCGRALIFQIVQVQQLNY